MSDLNFTQGDTAPSVFGSLTLSNQPVDLTGCTVRFQMRNALEARLAVDAPAVILSPAAGTVRYDLEPGDTASSGDFLMRWRIAYGDGTVQHTEPENTITIEPI